jgi:hypothetical protein
MPTYIGFRLNRSCGLPLALIVAPFVFAVQIKPYFEESERLRRK